MLGPGHRHDALETDRPEPVLEGAASGLVARPRPQEARDSA